MRRLTLDILVPKNWQQISGGNHYNLDLAQTLIQKGHRVRWQPFDGDLSKLSSDAAADFILVDSILSQVWFRKITSIPSVGMIHLPQSFIEHDKATSTRLFRQDQQFFNCLDACVFVSEPTCIEALKTFNFSGSTCIIEPGRPKKPRFNSNASRVSSTLKLLNVGRLDENKNQATLIDALWQFSKYNPDISWSMTFCGPQMDGYFEHRMLPKIEAYGLAEKISWLGPLAREELSKVYRAADCLICSSHYESWGIVLMEAMAHGLALINFARGGARQITNIAQGFQVQSIDEFGACLKQLSENECLKQAQSRSTSGYHQLARWSDQVDKMVNWLRTLH